MEATVGPGAAAETWRLSRAPDPMRRRYGRLLQPDGSSSPRTLTLLLVRSAIRASIRWPRIALAASSAVSLSIPLTRIMPGSRIQVNSAITPATPGHVFSVTYSPGPGTATWTNLDGTGGPAFPDFPATGVAFDSGRGDLYVSNDWGVLRLPNGSTD